MSPAGLLHSDICGSQPVCGSPQLFAAYHVFLRPLMPRHSPCALCSLIFQLISQLFESCVLYEFCLKIVVFLPCDKKFSFKLYFAFFRFFVQFSRSRNQKISFLIPFKSYSSSSSLSDSFGLPLSTRLSPRSDWFFFCLPFLFFQKEK